MRSRRNVFTVLLLMGTLALLAACGGGTPTLTKPTFPTPIGLTVTAASSTVMMPGTVQMTATVTNASNTGVTWTMSPTTGTIDASGLFTPAHAGTYTITATCVANTAKKGSVTVTVTAPAPTFTSEPVTVASEGSVYSYTLAATDPLEGEITYTWASSSSHPAGAVLEGDTITWTPATAQARTTNSFAVVATTTAGGTAPHAWDVSTAGTIYGTAIDKYWTADGDHTDVPQDMTEAFVGALAMIDGVPVMLEGTGNADGTFIVPDVPPGKYWLLLGWDLPEFYWTDSSTFDFGTDYIGRPYNAEAMVDTTYTFNLFGLTPQMDCCYPLELASPNAGLGYWTDGYPNYEGATEYSSVEGPYTQRRIDPSLGDTSYMLQWDYASVLGPAEVDVVTSALASDTIATNPDDSTVTPVEGQMGPVNPRAFGMDVRGSEWSKLLLTAGPGTGSVEQFWAAVGSLPIVTDKYAYPQTEERFLELADMYIEPVPMNMDMGAFRYINPFPTSWRTLYSAQQWSAVQMYDPEYDEYFPWYISTSYMTDQSGPISPLMSNVQNPKVNGNSFFLTTSTDTPGLAITWDPPTGLAPFGYEISVSPDFIPLTLYFYTSENSITFPPTMFPSGRYIFTIRAMADGKANVATSPWRSQLPMADSQVVSGILTMTGGSPEALALRLKAKKPVTNAAKSGGTQLTGFKAAATIKPRHMRSITQKHDSRKKFSKPSTF